MDPAADRAAITELLIDYVSAIDRRDFDRVASVFTADATLDYSSPGGPIGGITEVVGWLETMLSAVTFTQHLLTNIRVELAGDTATAHGQLLNPLLIAGDETQLHLLGGSYRDGLRRTADGWRIEDRVHVTAWSAGPLPAHLLSRQT